MLLFIVFQKLNAEIALKECEYSEILHFLSTIILSLHKT